MVFEKFEMKFLLASFFALILACAVINLSSVCATHNQNRVKREDGTNFGGFSMSIGAQIINSGIDKKLHEKLGKNYSK